MVDPQSQAIKWIKNMEGKKVGVRLVVGPVVRKVRLVIRKVRLVVRLWSGWWSERSGWWSGCGQAGGQKGQAAGQACGRWVDLVLALHDAVMIKPND